MTNREKILKKHEGELFLYSTIFSVLWEFAHSSFYQDHSQDAFYVLWSRIHCSVGDVMIFFVCYVLTCLMFRSRTWLVEKGILPKAVFVLAGLGYTIYSEYHNTRISESWSYAEGMPTVLGIGVSPILQWIIVPMFILYLVPFCSKKSP